MNLDLLSDPINDRAWTLQESLLSARMLIYSQTQLLFRCHTKLENTGGHLSWALIAERAPILALSDDPPIDKDKQHTISLAQVTIAILFGHDAYIVTPEEYPADYVQPEAISLSRAQKEWLRIICMYSRRQMTNPTDVFPAIAGIAEEFHALTNDSYCAGLWMQHLLIGLSWRRDMSSSSSASTPTSRVHPWRAPSWSWASLDGAINYDLTHAHWSFMKPIAQAHHVAISRHPTQSRYGQLVAAEAILEGALRPIEIEPVLEPVVPLAGESRLTISQFADVYIIDPARRVYDGSQRCGTAILDESIQRLPFSWRHAAYPPRGPLFAFTLFCSSKWSKAPARPDRRVRLHGLLVERRADGKFARVGWFDSFAFTGAEAEEVWLSREEWGVINLV